MNILLEEDKIYLVLPNEIWLHILLFLTDEDLNNVKKVNKMFYHLVSNDYFWQLQVQNTFQRYKKITYQSWYHLYNDLQYEKSLLNIPVYYVYNKREINLETSIYDVLYINNIYTNVDLTTIIDILNSWIDDANRLSNNKINVPQPT